MSNATEVLTKLFTGHAMRSVTRPHQSRQSKVFHEKWQQRRQQRQRRQLTLGHTKGIDSTISCKKGTKPNEAPDGTPQPSGT